MKRRSNGVSLPLLYATRMTEQDTKAKGRQNTLAFVNEEAQSVHGSVRTSSIFISQSGEWRLGGLDVLSSMKEDDAIIYVGYLAAIVLDQGLTTSADIWKSCTRFWTLCFPRSCEKWLGYNQASSGVCGRLARLRNTHLRSFQRWLYQQRSNRANEEYTAEHEPKLQETPESQSESETKRRPLPRPGKAKWWLF